MLVRQRLTISGSDGLPAGLTIKEMIVRALSSGHFQQGAKPNDIREFIKNAYGRDVPATSLSPQLTRLREEGTIEQTQGVLNNETWWRLVPGQVGTVEMTHDHSGEALDSSRIGDILGQALRDREAKEDDKEVTASLAEPAASSRVHRCIVMCVFRTTREIRGRHVRPSERRLSFNHQPT